MDSILSFNVYYFDKCENLQSYQLLIITHQSQIQLVLRIPLLSRVCYISYPLTLCIRKGSIFGMAFGGDSFLPSNWDYLNFYSPSWFWFFLANSVVVTLSQLILTFSILDILCKNKPPNIRMVSEAKNKWVKNASGGFFTFCKINIYGLKYFRCVLHELLNIISFTFFNILLSFYWT